LPHPSENPRAAQAAGAQDDKRTRDQIAAGAAIIVFWPAAFFVGGDSQTAAELARLKGQMEAMPPFRKSAAYSFSGHHQDSAHLTDITLSYDVSHSTISRL
jgi:hypothetical protein